MGFLRKGARREKEGRSYRRSEAGQGARTGRGIERSAGGRGDAAKLIEELLELESKERLRK